jgi:hypothetical protein
MMTRAASLILVALGLAACSPSVPDSNPQGVGFQDYNTYIRNAQARAAPPPVAAPVAAPPTTGFDPNAAAAAIARAEGNVTGAPLDPMAGGTGQLIGAPTSTAPISGPAVAAAPLDPNRPRGNAPAGIQPESGEVLAVNNPAISDENDFAAVSARETIESDKARIERNRSQYVVVQPGALPTREGDIGPNIVEYALATKHPPGTQLYNRSSLFRKDSLAACAKFASPDLAQQDFLANGGPDRDKAGLDPDGDGYACDWDPRPFRTALN